MTLDDIKGRLNTIGIDTFTEQDEALLNFLMTRVINEIQTRANITEIPAETEGQVIDIIAGEYLQNKKAVGADLGGIDLGLAAKSLKLGDTNIDFGNESQDQEFDRLISRMIKDNYNSVIASLRRFQW